MSAPQLDRLAAFTDKAYKVFLLALPFAVIFWAFGIGLPAGGDGEREWLSVPAVIAAVAFLAYVGGSLLRMVRGGAPQGKR